MGSKVTIFIKILSRFFIHLFSDVDINSGHGHYGSCCVELDIWEANSLATAFTLHPCDIVGPAVSYLLMSIQII